jgi:LRR receptor-like serine/threonine-protein kinase FLS2
MFSLLFIVEYGLEGLVSTKCDVYSYGIILMEVFTKKKPNDDMFEGDVNLRGWIHKSILDSIAPIIDVNLLSTDFNYSNDDLDCVSSIMEVALNCTKESPKERYTMADVIFALEKIRLKAEQYIPYKDMNIQGKSTYNFT